MDLIENDTKNDAVWASMEEYSKAVEKELIPIQNELNIWLKEKLKPVQEKYPKFWVALIKQNYDSKEWEITRSIDSKDF